MATDFRLTQKSRICAKTKRHSIKVMHKNLKYSIQYIHILLAAESPLSQYLLTLKRRNTDKQGNMRMTHKMWNFPYDIVSEIQSYYI